MPFTVDGKWIPSKTESNHPKKTVVQKEKRKGRILTLIKNIDSSKIDLKDLLKVCKIKCHCGGTLQGDILELQGDHEENIKMILKQMDLL